MSSPDSEDDRTLLTWRSNIKAAFHSLLSHLTPKLFQSHGTIQEPDLSTGAKKDVEKGSHYDHQAFNLRDYLTSFNETNQIAGIQRKHLSVTWEDLQVVIPKNTNDKAYLKTCDVHILQNSLGLIRYIWRLLVRNPPARDSDGSIILHKCSGLAKPCEMILVLGRPGSGCTTFLKVIANDRGGHYAINGEVCYSGIDAAEMGMVYKGETVYNQDKDVHISTLTVAQTLAFAISTKTPGRKGRLPGVSSQEFNAQTQDMLLRILDISHVSDSLVGDEFVRGVSGGERKRVSIAEMLSTRARVQCWDNPTRGLDASTALDCVKTLRVMTDVLGQTTFVTLHQASEGIYNLFDRVLVLDEGRQIYLGPSSQARQYFERLGFQSLPRQTTTDYVTGCTNPNQRNVRPGRCVSDVPSSPEALERAFLASQLAVDLRDEFEENRMLMKTDKTDQEAFKRAVVLDKNSGASEESPYTLGFVGQVMVLARRQFQMRLQDRFQLVTSFSLTLVLALIIGAAFFDQPLTSNGAFTRTSVVFTSMLTSCLDAFGELSVQVSGRSVLHKQTSYSLYRPSALALGNTLSDIPFSAARVLIYDIIVYFMANLHRSGSSFWTFHLFNYMAFLSTQGFFRTLGLFFSSYDAAFRLGAFFVTNLVFYTGYLIPVEQMKKWLFWIFYLNPMAYAFSGLMENEYSRLNLTCGGDYVVPRNGFSVNKYPISLGPNQVCTLPGATPGSNVISGRSYLLNTYGMDGHDIWRRNFVVLLGWVLFYQVTQILVLDFFPSSEICTLNARLRERKASRSQANTNEKDDSENVDTKKNVAGLPSDRGVFIWERVNYHVPVFGGRRQLLSDVYGYIKPGTLTALMGVSGAGKTTCLDVLAQRKNIGVVCGDILVDGCPVGTEFARSTGYAEQMDVHEGTATVREAMRFSAYLRQPLDFPKEDKNAYIEEIIELLELQDFANAIVGTLDIGARKRLTIGVELASKPGLLLFLDEPTSGLDAQSAWNLVRVLRRLADQGQAILCTIHQPSSVLFESFDRLLLLVKGGHTVYFGDIGPGSSVVREYFARYGAVCPPHANPAEHILDVTGAGLTPRIGNRDWRDVWLDSPEFHLIFSHLKDATPFLHQLTVVTKRSFVTLWRSPDYIFTRLFLHFFTSLFVSLVFLQLERSSRDLQYRVFSIFWVTVLPSILINQILPVFITKREFSRAMYSPEVFAIAQFLGEIPYSALCAVVYWIIMIYVQGFGQGSAGLGGIWLQLVVILFVELFGVSLGQLIAAITPSVQVGVLFDPFIMVVLTTFCGVTIPFPYLAHSWRLLVYQLNPFTRLLGAMLATELHGLQIQCKLDEFAVFEPPPGQSCAAWANDFVNAFGGYLDNPSELQGCRYCQFKVGDEYMIPLNMYYENRWKDTLIIFAFFAASRLIRYMKR
ncbi:ABC-2 type transporter-domain-containing protein [Multifurca ochricompacta]|uniref:ABC-2 type transporter-domain-containing protein n=1 Tax=Multifurca ochricompacta TaxID=376703 RepID=A0AAD4MC11_9AGAM|nr:ABC-2 type transporter-domain-containing protein [Multifurca ochricompacta]